jgi:uncharacterized protein (DUF924 family)
MTTPAAVLDFWFADGPDTWRQAWFQKDDAFDALIHERLSGLHARAHDGALDGWGASAEGALALAILLDQVPRNVFRGDPRAFGSDPAARRIARAAVAARHDLSLTGMQRIFLYLPFEHSETMEDQDLSVALFEGLRDDPRHARPNGTIDYAWRHWHVIRRFGRFPHRNVILGRQSTAAEVTYLSRPGAGF